MGIVVRLRLREGVFDGLVVYRKGKMGVGGYCLRWDGIARWMGGFDMVRYVRVWYGIVGVIDSLGFNTRG